MHHFQLKPVRSLDNLRPAWSGHLRHGPPPSTIITNPHQVSLTKQLFFSSHPLPPNNLVNQLEPCISNSTTTKSNNTVEIETSSVLPALHNQSAQSNQFLCELHVHNNFMKTVVNLSSIIHEKENAKSEEKFSSNDRKFNSKNIFTNTNSIPNTWESKSFDKSFKTSNFFCEVNEDDPFDTSRVEYFMPTYLQQTAPFFKSTIPPTSVKFYPLSHPFNTTSYSAQAKVNIIIHYFLFL